MVKPMLRTDAKKKVRKRTPGGRTTTHYREAKPGRKTCGRCGKQLSGVPNNIKSVIRNLSKSEKVPNRPYAGVLCPQCVEKLVRYVTRFEVKKRYPEYADLEIKRDLTLEKYLPPGWFKGLGK